MVTLVVKSFIIERMCCKQLKKIDETKKKLKTQS